MNAYNMSVYFIVSAVLLYAKCTVHAIAKYMYTVHAIAGPATCRWDTNGMRGGRGCAEYWSGVVWG